MEYPTITSIGGTKIDLLLEIVIMHEVGHNWFYGMLGFNEREHPWMDEGINTFSEIRYMMEKYKDKNMVSLALNDFAAKALGVKKLQYSSFHKFQYLNVANTNQDQPANLHSVDFKPINYSTIAYSKTGHAFYMLLNYLGEEKFDAIMKAFFENWKFKHPYPEDLEKAFRKHTDQNLDWFFETMLKTNQKTDYAAKRVKDNKLLVVNKQEGATPFSISGIKNGEVQFTRWHDGFEEEKWIEVSDTDVDRYHIDYHKTTLDINERNNEIKPQGIFPKVNPLSIHLFGPIAQTNYTQINVSPALGYNYYNGFMSGIYFNTSFMPENPFKYNLIPLYGFHNNDFAGTGDVSYTVYPDKTPFKNIEFKLAGRIFAYSNQQGYHYNKLKFSTKFNLRQKGATNNIYNTFTVNSIYATDVWDLLTTPKGPDHKLFVSLSHYYRNYEGQNSFRNKIQLQGSDDFIKTQVESNFTLKLKPYSSKSIQFRLFGGAFLLEDNIQSPYYLRMGGATGIQDYTYEETYFGRFELPENPARGQLWSQQFVTDQGGFAIYSPFGQSNEWLLSLNAVSPILAISDILPVKLYGNIATFGNTLVVPGYESENFGWETGVQVTLTDALEIYFPLWMSDYIKDYSNNITDNYWQKIRFMFDLRNITIGF
jgi:hypothetical protein